MPARTVPAFAISLAVAAIVGVGCGSDDGGAGNDGGGGGSDVAGASEAPAETMAPTTCVTGEGDPGRTITLGIDDEVGGFGSIGSRAPSDLTAGAVRIVVDADAENAGPVDVTLTLDGAVVTTIAGVAPGTTCGVDVELEPGDYLATSNVNGDSDAAFTIIA